MNRIVRILDEQAGAGGDGGYKMQALNVLAEVTASLATDADIEGLLQRFLGTMIRLAGATAGAVRVLTTDGSHLRLIGSLGLPPDAVERANLVGLDCSHCGNALRKGHILRAVDVKVCAEHTASKFFRQDCRAMVVVPLQFRGKMLGVYNLYLRERQDVPEELALLFRTISEHLGMTLENTRLERENLRIAMMNERQMMANEVHDSLAQTLAYMKMRMALMQDAMNDGDNDRACSMALDVKNALDDAYSGLRELLSQFRKRMDPLGLLHALENLADEFHDRTGVTIEYCNHITDLHLSVDQKIQVFYIVQEALANVTRHSGATEVKLTLEQKADRYEVTIDDNGSGFFAIGNPLGSFDEHPSLKQHFGLTIMRERAQRLRGNRILRGPLAAPRGIVRQRAGPGDTGSTTQGPVQAWSASVCPANRRTALRPGFGKLLSLSNESRRPASDASGRRLVAYGRARQLSPVQASDEAWPCDGSGPAERRLGARNIEQHLEAIRPEEVRSACVTQS